MEESIDLYEDGIYEVHTKVGVVTIVIDSNSKQVPMRLYGPDGMEVDPQNVLREICPHGNTTGFAAYDLSHFLPH